MSEIFNSGGQVQLLVNGDPKGSFDTAGQTVGQFVKAKAASFGLKSFSVYVNGAKFYTEQANDPLPDGSKVELVAKDARGIISRLKRPFIMILTGGESPTPAQVMTPQPPTTPDNGGEQPAQA